MYQQQVNHLDLERSSAVPRTFVHNSDQRTGHLSGISKLPYYVVLCMLKDMFEDSTAGDRAYPTKTLAANYIEEPSRNTAFIARPRSS